MISVAIVEDDQAIRNALARLIGGTAGYVCQGVFASCEDAMEAVLADPPDVLLMDIGLPGMTGVEGVRRIKQQLAHRDRPDIDIVMLTVREDDRTVFESLCAGACGYLLKTSPPARILAAIREVKEGGAPMSPPIARLVARSFQGLRESPLTPRETEVLTMLCEGKSHKAIADALFISQGTVHSHLKSIYKKLAVNSKAEAIVKAFRERLI
jgi:DNA-binding NarL/FixJ family response regulator